ncbi:MAG: ADP-ribosylglycohydrolase [Bacteroidales bacterium]|jgi:ADP-ribosylglycohydrolase|nr:ADP-ribosylglycohydrolase [Bacteroidales bacterium]
MIGVVIGDIAGSTFEFNNTDDYNFPLFARGSDYTDDTICSVAVADAILSGKSYQESLHAWCNKYPDPKGAYGGSFSRWIMSSKPKPYNSFGNGAAMRVGPVGWAFEAESIVAAEAQKSAECTHNHPEGIKGAVAVAKAIFMLRTTKDKNSLSDIIAMYDGYKRPKRGVFDVTCQGCVPLALDIIMQSRNFEDAIRLAVSYGGDTDTVGAIVGAMAEAIYDVPSNLREMAFAMLPDEMKVVVSEFEAKYNA